MNYAIYDAPTTTSENRIIPFRKKQLSSKTDSLSSVFTSMDIIEPEVKNYFEGIVYSAMIRDALLSLTRIDDPFGALYICDLQPDRLNRKDFMLLSHLASRIRDLSDEISFNDGMDD